MPVEVEYAGVRVAVRPDVYDPSDDSYLLADHAAVGPRRVLEIGCGTGLASLVAAASGARVVAVDVNPAAVGLARDNARDNGLDVWFVVADTFRGLRLDRIDVVLTNPPYLPTRESDRVQGPLNAAFDAGADGLAFLRSFALFLGEARGQLVPGFEVRMVVSSLQGLDAVRGILAGVGFTMEERDVRGMGLESLHLVVARPEETSP